jgi:hypothetical protein
MMSTSGDHAAKGMSTRHIDKNIVRDIEMPTHFLKMVYQLSHSARDMPQNPEFISDWLL